MAKQTDTLTADEQRAYAVRQAQIELDRILATFPELRNGSLPAPRQAAPEPAPARPPRIRRPVSAATRKRMAARMKARWKEAKAKGRKKL